MKLRRPGDGDLCDDLKGILQPDYTGNLRSDHSVSLDRVPAPSQVPSRERPSFRM
jgi:hypothetical protein